ncbi:DeoR/GlpR family DNA-binding transcription regulator [Herbiconiux sp. L3-i23]|uniref:DeoR/GlpR family DNA-binding transcription regulator n=1 Tax=Herbiconiux sp. L3-i23 TaxID=2905871 RepID=UPI0020614A0B|nr:DeoR/GlpR family DNA-binding transcription regulator [Herbiconiux sp. L3-i23]BDI21467.1 DeoR family transcriptional regulator [Herbiconiux sp. L3-i23]
MRYTEAPARREELLRRIASDGYVSSSAIAEEFGVSEMTIRRDLRQLHLDGAARRVAGGASLPSGVSRGAPFEERDRHAGLEKQVIAARCAELLRGAGTIAIDAGTTAAAVAALLEGPATVVTHSVPVITACTERDDIELIGLGGRYEPSTRSFGGSSVTAVLDRVAIDVAVLSATAVDETGLLCVNEIDAETKRAMAAAARRTILVVDSTKIGGRAPIRFGRLSSIDTVVTSDATGEVERAILAEAPELLYAAMPLEGVR